MGRVLLCDSDRDALREAARKPTAQARFVLRARILLCLSEGATQAQTALKLGIHRSLVQRALGRYLDGGVAALQRDRPRSGRPKKVTLETVEAILALTTQALPEKGTHWSVRTMAPVAGVSPATVQRVWSSHGLKPHLVRSFKLSTDPKFASKLVDVVGLYLDPPEKAMVLCVDEKSQIQALDRTQPGLPMKKGRCGTMTHEYKRSGTTTLFAALSTLDGAVIGSCKKRHRHEEFLAFLKQIDRKTPADLELHLVLDNYATHKHPDVKEWLRARNATQARFHLHFVPTSCSWLNLVERFFAEITNKAIRRGTFTSVRDLEDTIRAYLNAHNKDPKPFKWTATAESILDKVNRGLRTLETLH
jgi:transposase